MEPRHLYTIKWTQEYATNHLRPFLRSLQEQMEAEIENRLEHGDFAEANTVIERIKQL
jgi:uncharacterized membrane protein required for colicin V production